MSIKSTNSVFLYQRKRDVFFLLARFIELKYIKDFLLFRKKRKTKTSATGLILLSYFFREEKYRTIEYQLGYTTVPSILVTLSIVYIHLGLEKLVIVNIWKKRRSKKCKTCNSIVRHVFDINCQYKKLYE